ncbi:MAG: nucleotidyltransferase domain-containing protein [Mariprofundaceae bacterium]|nr:nucleotidyltransferase domain-containing protein [Mariprofundaceae bacterium]
MIDHGKSLELAKRIQSEVPSVLGVYLFGSVAKGVSNASSDIDLALLASDSLSVLEVWLLAQRLAQDIGVDVDLIDLRSANAVMRMQVIAKGRRLLCVDEPICEQFEDFVYADFARLNEERAAILMDVQSRGTVYG